MKTLNDMRSLSKEIEAKRQQQDRAKEEETLKEYRHLHGEAEKKKKQILDVIHASRHVKVENFLSRVRYEYAIIFFCTASICVSLWMCSDLILNGKDLFRAPATKVLPPGSSASADVGDQLHKILDGVKFADLMNSDKLSLGNVSGPRKNEIYGNLNLISGQPFTVSTIVQRRDPESYSAFCNFDNAGGYIIELARSEKGFSIIKVDSDN